MGFGKKWKKAGATIIKAIPGGEKIAQFTSLAGMINREEANAKQDKATAEQQALQTDALNAQIAEQTRLNLLSENDLKAQEEELKKRTIFAGLSTQGVMERKKLLGI